MKLPRRNFLHLAAGAAALQFAPLVARAQAYPSRPYGVSPNGLISERFRSGPRKPDAGSW